MKELKSQVATNREDFGNLCAEIEQMLLLESESGSSFDALVAMWKGLRRSQELLARQGAEGEGDAELQGSVERVGVLRKRQEEREVAAAVERARALEQQKRLERARARELEKRFVVRSGYCPTYFHIMNKTVGIDRMVFSFIKPFYFMPPLKNRIFETFVGESSEGPLGNNLNLFLSEKKNLICLYLFENFIFYSLVKKNLQVLIRILLIC